MAHETNMHLCSTERNLANYWLGNPMLFTSKSKLLVNKVKFEQVPFDLEDSNFPDICKESLLHPLSRPDRLTPTQYKEANHKQQICICWAYG